MNSECLTSEQNINDFHNFLQTEREHLLDGWSQSEAIQCLVTRLNLSIDEHRNIIAVPVLDNLITMLKQADMVADCPIMRQLVETFYNRDLTVEDVFLNCTGLKNAILSLLFADKTRHFDLDGLMAILDNNLYRVLAVYTEKLQEHQKDLQMHNRIIEEHVVLTITDPKGKIIYVTDAFCKLTGYSKEELLGYDHSIIRHPEMRDNLFKGMWKCIREGRTWHGKIKNRKKGGGEFIASTEIIPVKDKNGAIIEYMAIRNDITDKELSGLDPLTGLYNRRKFDKLMAEHFSKESTLTLMLIDIDHFKAINDTFGHQKGDEVITAFADILKKNIRNKDICARWGGEEFVIIFPDTVLDITERVAERIRSMTETTPILEDHPVRCSIGLTQRSKGDTVQSFFKRADSLLYRAKNSGRNRIETE